MSVQIRNHSDGTLAGVTNENQLMVVAEDHSLQHHSSWKEGQAYQLHCTDTGITAKAQTILHIKNTSTTHNIVVGYIRMQDLTTITTHAAGHFFEVLLGDTVASGGTAFTPLNMNATSGNVAACTCTGVDPTMDGVGVRADKIHTILGDAAVYNKHGAIILGLNDTFSIRLTSTGTGEAWARLSFTMIAASRD